MERPRLYLSRDTADDWLSAIAFGTVDDGQPLENWIGLSEQVGFLMESPYGPVIGFCVKRFSELDLDSDDHEPMWSGPRFDVPVLGLRDVSAAEICLAARAFLGEDPTRCSSSAGTRRPTGTCARTRRSCRRTRGRCWLGRACEALGDLDEASDAYRQAVELEEEGADETDAAEGLERLSGGRRERS